MILSIRSGARSGKKTSHSVNMTDGHSADEKVRRRTSTSTSTHRRASSSLASVPDMCDVPASTELLPAIVDPVILRNVLLYIDPSCFPALMATSHAFLDLAAPKLYKHIKVDLHEATNPLNGVNFRRRLHPRPSGQTQINSKRYVLRDNVESMCITPHSGVHVALGKMLGGNNHIHDDVITPNIDMPKLKVIRSTRFAFCLSGQDYLERPACGPVCPLLARARPTVLIHEPSETDEPFRANPDLRRAERYSPCIMVPLPETIATLIHILRPANLHGDTWAYKSCFSSLVVAGHRPDIHILFVPASTGWKLPVRPHGRFVSTWDMLIFFLHQLARLGRQRITLVGLELLMDRMPYEVRAAPDRTAAIGKHARRALEGFYENDLVSAEVSALKAFRFVTLEKWAKEQMHEDWGLCEQVDQWLEEARTRGTSA